MQFGDYFVPEKALDWSFAPSGGPGGQHANRSNTRAILRFDLGNFEPVPDNVRRHMLARLGSRAPDGVVTVVVDETRSQRTNRDIALERMRHLLNESLQRPRRRRPTRPTAASRERRLEAKRRQSERKANRRSID
ncbi:MAG: aminoacyl-tRNA hydrolase [Actinobacteria bacterium]|nr:aminoacyl-tRNA hydrolase [Actinomycetota bacterium]